MQRIKLEKKINNLEKVKRVVELAKYDTLRKIEMSQSIKDHHYDMAKISQKAINYATSLNGISYNLSKKLYKDNDKTLWIYITIPSRMIKISYEKFENIISNNFDRNRDDIIVIGDPGLKFTKRFNVEPILYYNDLDKSSTQISSVINNYILNYIYGSVKIVANTSKSKNKPIKIFPFQNIEYRKREWKKYKYYYSLSDILKNISSNYINNIISGVYQEAYRLFYVEKLSRHEGSLKKIESKKSELISSVFKTKRNRETEDIIHTAQISKRR